MALFGEIDHVGIVVADLEAAVTYYRDTFGCEEVDRFAGNDTAEVLLRVAESYLRLIQPTTTVGHAADFLATHGEGVLSIGFRVVNATLALEGIKLLGHPVIDEEPRLMADGSYSARIAPQHGGAIIELVQRAT